MDSQMVPSRAGRLQGADSCSSAESGMHWPAGSALGWEGVSPAGAQALCSRAWAGLLSVNKVWREVQGGLEKDSVRRQR